MIQIHPVSLPTFFCRHERARARSVALKLEMLNVAGNRRFYGTEE